MKNFALMSAIALTSTIGFTACSSSEDATEPTTDVNPTFDGTSVRTDFAFSVAGGPMSATRMGGGIVQETSGTFNGMKDMYLFPFSATPAISVVTNYANGTTKNYPLGTLTGITNEQSSKVYALQIPVGTSNFLFYATSNPNETTKIKKGSLNSSLTQTIGNTEDITFSLDKILTTTTLGSDATHMADYLSYIAQAEVASTADANVKIHWYDAPTQAQTIGQYSTLAKMYNDFTGIGTYDSRAGSEEAVLRTVFDLYVTASAIVSTGSEGDVKNLADEICKRITSGKRDNENIVISSRIAVDKTADANDPTKWTYKWYNEANKPTATFPHNLGLPMGAAQLSYNATSHTFSYKDPVWYELHSSDTPTTITGTSVDIKKICYPAELIYFDNSPLRATNSYKQVNDYPKTVANWDADLGTTNGFSTDWNNTTVQPSTRAVAMQNNVNYGVALLQTTVKLKDAEAQSMNDNMKALTGSTSDNVIDGKKFEVTGIIVGGQPATVGWNMTNPGLKDGTLGKSDFSSVIYDQDITFANTPISTVESAKNYTLVLDNYVSGSSQSTIRIALELVNKSGSDFYGINGIIPAGHTFYLCGELNPASPESPYVKATRKSSYRITEEGTARVFIQDYKTVANITIGKESLKKAYNTIPDLRSTEVLFGLSVDLTWENGLTFNVEM